MAAFTAFDPFPAETCCENARSKEKVKQSRYISVKRGSTKDRPLDPQRKTTEYRVVKLSDRVETAHGPGTVIEIEGDRYLIALDGQIARVWERLNSLKVVSSKQH